VLGGCAVDCTLREAGVLTGALGVLIGDGGGARPDADAETDAGVLAGAAGPAGGGTALPSSAAGLRLTTPSNSSAVCCVSNVK
jgi:hypothetical protein